MTADTKAVARWDAVGPDMAMDESSGGAFVLLTDHERVVGELKLGYDEWMRLTAQQTHQIRILAEALAASRAEVEGFKKVVPEITDCLDDTVHERGGWATEEIICMGRDAAMEKGNV